MPRGRGRGSAGRVGISSVRGNFATRKNMPIVPIPTINSQQDGTSSSGGPDRINQVQTLGPSSTPPIQTSGHGSTPIINLEPSPNTPNQRNTIGEGTSSQNNIIGETECNSTRGPQTLLTISPTGLEPSYECSECITKSFRHELDPNGVNWKRVSDEIKKNYFGEFKKAFYWDSSIDIAVQVQWELRVAKRYRAELPLGLTQVALSVLGSIARDLLLKMVEIQHQVSCICTSIHMVMMENLLLLRNPESYMKNIRRYYNNKHRLNLILISVKHIIKLREEKRKEEYMVLDLKQNATTG